MDTKNLITSEQPHPRDSCREGKREEAAQLVKEAVKLKSSARNTTKKCTWKDQSQDRSNVIELKWIKIRKGKQAENR